MQATALSSIAIALALAAAGCGSGGSEPSPERPAAGERPRAGGGGQPSARGGDRRPARRLEGARKLVFAGDSLAVAGEAPPYPELLGERVGRDLEIVNLAEAGTTSADWVPGAPLFEQRLRPALRGAEAFFFTVGGNDLEEALAGADGPGALERAGEPGALEAIDSAFRRLRRNLAGTFAGAGRISPRAPIVFVGYPDYSASEVWRGRAGVAGTLALRVGLESFAPLAAAAGADLDLDLLSVSGPRIDGLLSDGEHLSAAGHDLYARRLARLLEP